MARRQPQAGGLITLGTRVPQSLRKRLRVYCAERDIEMQRFVEEAVRERLDAEQRPRRRPVRG